MSLLDELGDVSNNVVNNVVEGLKKLSIRDSLLLHFEHGDVHNLADRCMVKLLKFPFTFGGQGPGFCSP